MIDPGSLIRPEIAALQAYHVPPARDVIKLDAMENPYQWPDEMKAEWQSIVTKISVNRYPDAGASELKDALREVMDIDGSQQIMLGNGSDEIIQIVAMALAKPGAAILAPEPGFVMYKMIAAFTGMRYIGVPLDENFDLDMPAMREAIAHEKPALTFLAYPNNPTGNLFNDAAIDEILDTAPGVVILDEAYHPFAGGKSYMPKLTQYSNLLVMRTVSKMGLAGLRLGLLAGAPKWLEQFEKVRLPYNINSLTQAAAKFALKNDRVFQQQAQLICRERHRVFKVLSTIAGISAYPSEANFILLKVLDNADALHTHLLERGVLVKNLNPAGGILDGCLRVTIGTPDENDVLLEAIARS